MNPGRAIRTVHRWTSIVFLAVVVGIFLILGAGREPAQWVYFVPLAPLAVLAISGLYLFVSPYAARWRGGRSSRET